MLFWDSLRTAFGSLRANKLRSTLTVIGIIFGVGSVMVMMSLVEGARAKVMKEFETLGAGTIFIVFAPEDRTLGKRGVFEGLTMDDVDAIRDECKLITYVSPERQFWDRVVRGKREHRGRISGVGAEINDIVNVAIDKGRSIRAEDVSEAECVCVIGPSVADELFGPEDPLGKEVRIRGVRLTVVGVREEQGRVMGQDLDAYVHVPVSVVLKRLVGGKILNTIQAKAVTPGQVEEAADEIWSVLRRRHKNVRDFIVDTPASMLAAINKTINVFTVVLGAIGGLALLVAGIGIMNIMLVSVTERTREIGIRKAVGGTQRALMVQFLTEAGALSGGGGLIGVGFGYALAWTVNAVMKERLPTHVPLWSAILAFSVSVAIGIFFGWYPAWKAAKMDPIEALRTE